MGGLRTRSVLGGDDLDGSADELPAAAMGVISSVLGTTRPVLLGAISLLFLSLSSIFLGCNSFEGKINPEMVLHPLSLILQLTQKTNSV